MKLCPISTHTGGGLVPSLTCLCFNINSKTGFLLLYVLRTLTIQEISIRETQPSIHASQEMYVK